MFTQPCVVYPAIDEIAELRNEYLLDDVRIDRDDVEVGAEVESGGAVDGASNQTLVLQTKSNSYRPSPSSVTIVCKSRNARTTSLCRPVPCAR